MNKCTEIGGAMVTAMYLFHGFMRVGGLREDEAGHFGGEIGAAGSLEPWACTIEGIWRDVSERRDCAGVWDYEVSQAFGEWLRANRDYDESAAHAELVRLVSEVITPDPDERHTVVAEVQAFFGKVTA